MPLNKDEWRETFMQPTLKIWYKEFTVVVVLNKITKF